MSPERWERVHDALQTALERPAHARAELLEEVAHGDATLAREVRSLLGHDTGAGAFDVLVRRFVASSAEDLAPPPRIGSYRPIELLGRGGMGTVWLAERADGAFEQRVALKLLPAGTGADVHSRFLAERRILARLCHPNIARLLDGGTTEGGLPWLALEHVVGQPLTTFCEARGLPIEGRLRLFLDVCAAVSYAHANLVVHRDIKPANVLVVEEATDTDGPAVKLLDFGIAKLLDDEPPLGRTGPTRAGLRLLTPDYAAPEQIRGESVATTTDVYQLGVLLFELLTGRRPLRFSSSALPHLERVICGEEPPRPSAVVEDGAARRLAGDLDTIVVKALAKDPERRYGSVDALAADLRRHLEGLPVLARPDTFAYRAGKFARRHRAAVATGSAVALLLAGAGASLVVQYGRAADERDRAELAASFLTELFEDLEPVQAKGATVPAREMLDRSAARVGTELEARPLLQARLFDVLGRVYTMRGYYAEAEPLLRRALALRVDRLGPDDLQVAESRATLAAFLEETARFEEAETLMSEAVDVYRSHFGPDDPQVSRVEIDRALVLRAAGSLDDAQALLGDVVLALRRSPEESGADLATALLYLGKVRLERGDGTGAEAPLAEALAIRLALFGEEHPTVANAFDGIGELAQAGGDLIAAEEAFRHALAIRRALFPENHADVGVSLENLGIVLHEQGRSGEAATLLRGALVILGPTFGPAHPLVTTAEAYLDSVGVVAAAAPDGAR